MAWQHFYSRVPARVSMYNRADGFDTFAQSEGLEREFVERELAPVYENKLSKNDVSVVRKNEMPCVYTQCCTRSGVLVQNCISFLPLDYTGERSAYLSHSLICSPEEKKTVLSGKEEAIFNPDLFVTDIDGFEITAPNAVPDSKYPEKEYFPGAASGDMLLLQDVSPETAKAFLYAILSALCGKGKNIAFKLPGSNEQLSLRAVQLFNEILSILPSQIRASLSFASYVTELTQYSGYKLKGVSAQFAEASAAKCVYFNLQTNFVMGMAHEEVVANKALVNFFYSLLENKGLRAEFLSYMERAAEAVPSLQNLNLKSLHSLVFLFQCSCGLFPEQEILPNDGMVYECLCAYEKYRAALNEEYRMQVYKCLLRYPQSHVAIPKNIFAKVARLYGGESRGAKRVFMNVVLELIHTDIMRDKLFTFIRSNYQAEDEDVKQTVIADLCRVFYGGFLQNQLLTFFDQQFEAESEESKTLIVEKLLLSIRTPAVQGKILAFFDQHYEHLSDAHKRAFYDTFLEMLPECDALAGSLVQAVNGHIETEGDVHRAALAQRLTEVLEADYRRKEHALMPILAFHPGFCRDLVARLAFGPWQGRKLREEYIALLSRQPVLERTAVLVRAFELVPELDRASLLAELEVLYSTGKEESLYTWLDMAALLPALPPDIGARLRDAVVTPAVCRTLREVFSPGPQGDGLTLLEAYADENPAVRECENYTVIRTYRAMLSAAEKGDCLAAMAAAEELMAHTDLTASIAGHMARRVAGAQALTPESELCLAILQGFFKSRTAPLDRLYREWTGYYLRRQGESDSGKAQRDAAEQAMSLMLTVCLGLCKSSEAAGDLLCALESGGAGMAAAFAADFGKGADHWLRSRLDRDGGNTPFAALLTEKAAGQKAAGGSLFSRLFGKKK